MMAFRCTLCNPPKQFTHPVFYNQHNEKMHSLKVSTLLKPPVHNNEAHHVPDRIDADSKETGNVMQLLQQMMQETSLEQVVHSQNPPSHTRSNGGSYLTEAQNSQSVSLSPVLQANQRPGTNPLWCQLCDAHFSGPECAVAHFNGKKHKKKVQNSLSVAQLNIPSNLCTPNIPSTLCMPNIPSTLCMPNIPSTLCMPEFDLSQQPPSDVTVFEVDEDVNFQ